MKEGYLLKRSDTLKRWRTRWFRLDNRSGRLFYKETREDKVVRGVFSLVDVCVGPLQSPSKHLNYFCFYVRSSSVSLILAAESVDVANRWMECIAVAAANASAKASAWRSGSVPEASPAVLRNATRNAPDVGLGRATAPLASMPVTASPHSSGQEKQDSVGGNQHLSQAEEIVRRSSSSGATCAGVEASKPNTSPSPRKLDVEVESWLPDSAAMGGTETPFETPLSSGEPSPATPPSLVPDCAGLQTQASVLDVVSDGGWPASALEEAAAPAEPGGRSSERTEADDCLSLVGSTLAEGLLEVPPTKHNEPSHCCPSSHLVGLHPGQTTSRAHSQREFPPVGGSEVACLGSTPALERSGESDVGTADTDSFQFRALPASSSSSAGYTRHIGPPFGWASVTPRFASNRPSPRARPNSFFPSPRKPGPKQGHAGLAAGPSMSGRSTAGSGASPPSTDLHKLSKGQLIAMLQMARDAAAAKDEQLALMQSVAQIDARELAKAMQQAEESAAQAQAALARQHEQARTELEERLAQAGTAADIELRRMRDERDGLKTELEAERAKGEHLQEEVRQMEAELLHHAQRAALSAAECKELRSHEARCKELEARLASLSTRVHGTETALLKPFW